ncbi:MAG TPA: CpsD/CapB family tyrosine-protein kinase [Vicinamibacterales bacterium]|nr:CpsD/CapB family tyrosine-protein kinase [Vicinamibacterales bacterium]
MTRLHRAVEKAEREGRLSWTLPETRPPAQPQEPEPLDPPATAAPPDADAFALADPVAMPSQPADGDLGMDPLFVAVTAPGSLAAEQYRLLRTRIESHEQGRRTQILLVTSPRIGDGKTTTSANLALTMAQEFQQRVVLVEADLRRPTLAAQFGVRSEPGLVDVLVGAATLDEALVNVPDHQISLLSAGLPAARSSELLASTMMQRTLTALRGRFTRIVIDTPPVALADTHVLARLADGVLVVVRAGVTPKPAVERALAGVDRDRLMGIVLNEVDETADEYAYAGRVAGE